MQVARSERGASCALWHAPHETACFGEVWRPGRAFGSWQVAHAGGFSTPFGPWALWQLAQPLPPPRLAAPCGALAFPAWHVAQLAAGPFAACAGVTFSRPPECASWQLVHAVWPRVVVFASGAWQVVHAGFGAGVWAGPWHVAQASCPLRALPASCAWHVAQGAFAVVKPCGVWHSAQVGAPVGSLWTVAAWKAFSVGARVWQLEHAAAFCATSFG